MNSEQLLKQVQINRDIIVRRSEHAFEHLEMLKKDFAHLITEEIALSIALNHSLVELYFNSSYTAAIDNSMATLDKFKDSGCRTLLALHMKMIGHCYAHTSHYDLAERYLTEALTTLSPADEDYKMARADVLHELAMAQEYVDPKSEKIKNYLTEARELLDEEQHTIRNANCLMGIGNYYNNIDDVDQALTHYHEAAEAFEKKYVLINMANCYSNLGGCYVKLKQLDEAEKYLNKALELRLRFGAPEQLSISYFNLAVLYKERGEFAKAKDFLLKTLKLVEDLGNKAFINRVNDMIRTLEMQEKA